MHAAKEVIFKTNAESKIEKNAISLQSNTALSTPPDQINHTNTFKKVTGDDHRVCFLNRADTTLSSTQH